MVFSVNKLEMKLKLQQSSSYELHRLNDGALPAKKEGGLYREGNKREKT
jgi:hypothetical protein